MAENERRILIFSSLQGFRAKCLMEIYFLGVFLIFFFIVNNKEYVAAFSTKRLRLLRPFVSNTFSMFTDTVICSQPIKDIFDEFKTVR